MKIIGIVGVALLAGCTGLTSPDPASPYYVYTSGWAIQLNQPLEIEPGAATVRLQYGRVVPRNSVQAYDPHCVVELNTVSDGPQILQPGRFEVLRVIRSTNDFFVDASPFLRAGWGSRDSGPTFLFFKTEFVLRDPAQPTLHSMTCAWDQMAPGSPMRHLTVGEINSTLGDWMRLIPPKVTL